LATKKAKQLDTHSVTRGMPKRIHFSISFYSLISKHLLVKMRAFMKMMTILGFFPVEKHLSGAFLGFSELV